MSNPDVTMAEQPSIYPADMRRPEGARPMERASCRWSVNVGEAERWASMLAGAGLAAWGLSGRRGSLLTAGLGAALIYRGATGHCHTYEALGADTARHGPMTAVGAGRGYKVEKTITINRSPAELYSFWRDVENLPKVMTHLTSVEAIDRERSHWTAEGALGRFVQWDAEIFNEEENELIAWRSLPGGDVDTAGSIRFKQLGHHRGTEVTVSIKYDPPAGKVGAWIATLSGSGLERKLNEDLRRFKQVMETGETPTTQGQPAGRR